MAKRAGHGIPKRIGRVRLPKALRKGAATILDLAKDPVVGQAVAAALVAGAGALAQGKSRREIVKAAGIGGGAASVAAAKTANRFPLAFAIAAGELAAGLTGALEDDKSKTANRKKRRAKAARAKP